MFLKKIRNSTWLTFIIVAFVIGVFITALINISHLATIIVIVSAFVLWLIMEIFSPKKLELGCPNAIQKNVQHIIGCKFGDDCSHQRYSSCSGTVVLSEGYFSCPSKNKRPKFSFNIFKNKNKKRR